MASKSEHYECIISDQADEIERLRTALEAVRGFLEQDNDENAERVAQMIDDALDGSLASPNCEGQNDG